jgi:hypothetical protein
MTSVRQLCTRMMCWVQGEDPPKPPPITLPHPTDLTGLYEACDNAEETLECKPYYTDEAHEARKDTLWLARALAVSNPTVAMHMLRLTATSTNIWGDHNAPLISTAREIARQTAPHHPQVAAQFAALACKLCPLGSLDEQTVLQDFETYLQPCAAENAALATQLAQETSRQHHRLNAKNQAHALES